MSLALEKRAWAAELPMIEKFVLIYLARVVKKHDGSNLYVSMKGVAKAIGACPRAAQNAMYRLIGDGYLERTVAANQPGGRRTNEYRLVIDRLPVLDEPTHEMRGSDNVIHLEPTHEMRGTHAPDAQNLDSIKEERIGGGDARATPEVLTPIQQVVEAFDAARTSAFGPRARQHPGDAATAKQFLDKVSLPDLIALIGRDMPTANPGNPPATLAYFRDSVERFAADRKSPGKDRSNVKRHPSSDRGFHDSSAVKIGCDIARAFVERRLAGV
jgi:hypothetical protein